jgi:hypothetical protein
MKKIIIIIVICFGAYTVVSQYSGTPSIRSIKSFVPFIKHELSTSDKAIKNAFDNKFSDLQIGGSGQVIKILPDDNKDKRHQRFILKLGSGQTLLIAHNIDLGVCQASCRLFLKGHDIFGKPHFHRNLSEEALRFPSIG